MSQNYYYLLLFIPVIILLVILYFQQKKSIQELNSLIAKEHFIDFSILNPKRLIYYFGFIFFMSALLIYSSTNPTKKQEVLQNQKLPADVIIAIDASLSMITKDNEAIFNRKYKKSRFDQAKAMAHYIIKHLPETKIGLISFSGMAVLHSPPTDDHVALQRQLSYLETHYYQQTGLSFKNLFKKIIHLYKRKERTMQVVIISDGEVPKNMPNRDFNKELDFLKQNKITIYTIGVGSTKGTNMEFYNPKDVQEKKSKKRIALTTITKRHDKILKKISKQTKGKFYILNKKLKIKKLIANLKETKYKPKNIKAQVKESTSLRYIVLFFLFFLLDVFIIDNRKLFKK